MYANNVNNGIIESGDFMRFLLRFDKTHFSRLFACEYYARNAKN